VGILVSAKCQQEVSKSSETLQGVYNKKKHEILTKQNTVKLYNDVAINLCIIYLLSSLSLFSLSAFLTKIFMLLIHKYFRIPTDFLNSLIF
jgi:hypothetical protein